MTKIKKCGQKQMKVIILKKKRQNEKKLRKKNEIAEIINPFNNIFTTFEGGGEQ